MILKNEFLVVSFFFSTPSHVSKIVGVLNATLNERVDYKRTETRRSVEGG